MIRTTDLTRSYGQHLALQPLSLDLEAGQVLGLIGPNGSGKTTFLRMLVGLVPATAGSVEIDGVRLRGDGKNVRERATFCPGELGFYPELTCRAQLRWCLRGRHRDAEQTAIQIADRLGLPIDQRLRSFSHGMKRQVLFSAAMAPDVPLRILDEPTEGLDPTKRAQVLDIIEEQVEDGRTVLLSSHHLGEIDRVCERMLFLAGGELIGDEVASALAERSRRLLLISWANDRDAERVRPAVEALADLGVKLLRQDGPRFSLELPNDDPRAFLEALLQDHDLPAPHVIEYGKLSLGELYLNLYGVEGL